MHRTPRRRRLALLAAMTACLIVGTGSSPARADIGGQLFATGGTVELEILAPTARLDSELFLLAPDGTRGETLATNRDVGKRITLGPFPAEQELTFGIYVPEIDATFLMGPAGRNPDGLAHANVTEVAPRTFDVGFEDRLGGGDLDYDDNVFRFTGNLAPNEPPVAGDQQLTTPEDTPLELTLTGSDPDGTIASFAVDGAPTHGTLSGTAPALTYTPAADFNGSDELTFVVTDDRGGTATGTVEIAVTPANDAPVARDDAGAADENEPVTVAVLANDDDVDGDALSARLAAGPAHGAATCSATACTYRPESNFAGSDSFSYEACDPSGACDAATVTVEVRRIGAAGRMTGGGRTARRLRHRVSLGCTAAQPGRLVVRSAAGRFRLTDVDYALCVDDPALAGSGWDTHTGSGTGTFAGEPGYTVEWTLTDGGPTDTASIVIRDPDGAVVLGIDGPLAAGDQKAHRR